MKTTVKTLKNRMYEEKKSIIESSLSELPNVFGKNQEKTLLNQLFDDIESQTDVEDFVWNFVDTFCSNELNVNDIFANRENANISHYISEILSEMDKTLESADYNSIEKVISGAGFRYMFGLANNKLEDLLKVYLIDNTITILDDINDDAELDSSGYDEFDTEESLLDDYVDLLISDITGGERIIHIEDRPQSVLDEVFELVF